MSEPYPVGLGYISYFLSDHFDNFFRSWASPIKVAFTFGAVGGFVSGVTVGYFGRKIIPPIAAILDKNKKQTAQNVVSNGQQTAQNGTVFNQAVEGIISYLIPILTEDASLFPELKTYMNCQTEIEGNDIDTLMEAVIPGLMTGYNDNLRVANFFALSAKFLKTKKEIPPEAVNGLNKKVNDLTRLCFKADMLLIYAEDDFELATMIKTDIQNVQGNGISVELVDNVGIGNLRLSALENVFKQYIYVCVVVTKKLKDDEIASFTGEMLLVDSLYNAKGRVIPVVTPGRNQEYNANMVYKTLKPWRYDRGTDNSNEQLKLLIQNASKTIFNETNAN